MLYIGGLRPRHIVGAYEDLGMEVVGTGYEFEEFVKRVQPDLIGSGIKEKYIFHKMGVPFRQMHSWDYSSLYHGYDGFAICARDMDMTINNPCWKSMQAPWQKSASDDAAAPVVASA